MRKPRYTGQQVPSGRQSTTPKPPSSAEARCVSETIFDAWKKKYAGRGAAELRPVKQLEEENRRLKQVEADLPLDKPCSRTD